MTVFDLMERLGGEILMNRIRAMIDGKIVIVAVLNVSRFCRKTSDASQKSIAAFTKTCAARGSGHPGK